MMNQEFDNISKKAVSCMRVMSIFGIGFLILAYVGFRIWAAFGLKADIPFGVDLTVIILLTALAAGDIIFAPMIRWHRYRYRVDEEIIDVMEGLIFISRNMAPIERIHQIEIKTGPIDRAFGLAKVIATTAGGTVTIRFLEAKKADEIAERVQQRIREIVAEQAVTE